MRPRTHQSCACLALGVARRCAKPSRAARMIQSATRNWSRLCQPVSKKKQRQLTDFNDAEFLGFAKSYLSEAFPNPQRIDCPGDSDLQRMAEHPVKARDAAVSEHLTSCSPCFNRYMEILANSKRRSASSAGP